jgi:hypothetical protein
MRGGARALVMAAAGLIVAAGVARAQPSSPPARLLDVPFLQQSEALCGGAATAMVMRYWGETGVYAETFSALVDRAAGGIRGEDLLRELSTRGWNAHSFRGDAELVRGRLSAGQPVIALVEDRPGVFHYIVIVAWANERVVYHDPARAPFRVAAESAFMKRWEVTGRWSLLALPGGDESIRSTDGPMRSVDGPMRSADEPMSRSADAPSRACSALVDEGVRIATGGDRGGSLQTLAAAADACPHDSAPWREMAGVYALDRAWPDAARHAREAVRRDPGDTHAWRIFATSRYLMDQPLEALDAWNALGEPMLDIVNVRGLEHTRHSAVTASMRLRVQEMLTRAAVATAERRLGDVPAAQVARVNYRPLPDGRAALDAVMIERSRSPFNRTGVAVIGVRAATDRELTVAVANPTSSGDLLSASWRWWQNRPRVAVSYAAPLKVGGVVRADVFYDEQTYGSSRVREVRRGGALSVTDWTTTGLRWEAAAAADVWKDRGTTFALGGRLDQRLASDRLSLQGSGSFMGGSFTAWTATTLAEWRSSRPHQGSVLIARGGLEFTSNEAPLALWPGAGLGHARATLLRAHSLLDDGVMTGDVFGRRLYSAGTEFRHWMKPITSVLRWAPALFVETARADRRIEPDAAWHVDAGAGIRVAIPGSQVLRIDLAKGLRDGSTVVSIGWSR